MNATIGRNLPANNRPTCQTIKIHLELSQVTSESIVHSFVKRHLDDVQPTLVACIPYQRMEAGVDDDRPAADPALELDLRIILVLDRVGADRQLLLFLFP